MHIVTRRAFGKLSTTIAAFALGLIFTLAGFAASAAESGNEARPAQDDKLQSEFLLDLTLEVQTPQNLGSVGGAVSSCRFPEARLPDLASKAPSFLPVATGSCSGPTDLASSTFASCYKLMMDKKSTYRGAELPLRLLVER